MYLIEFEANIKDGTEGKAIRKYDFIEMLTDQPKHLDETTVFLSREQANAREAVY